MTKTTIEKLMELHEKAHEIKSRRPIQLATELKAFHTAEVNKITANRDLSPSGKIKAKEALRADLAKQTLQQAAQIRAEYNEIAKEARKLAFETQATPYEAPADPIQVALFERGLSDLKTAVMLGANAERSIEAIHAFTSKWDGPYYADQIKKEYGTLATSVLGIEPSQANRTALSHVLERIETKATTPERDAAAQIIEVFEGAETRSLFLPGTAAQSSIASIVGNAGNRLNDADVALAEITTKEQQQTEGGN